MQSVTIIRNIDSGKSGGFASIRIASEEKGDEDIIQLGGSALLAGAS